MDWMATSHKDSHVEGLAPQRDDVQKGSLWEAIRIIWGHKGRALHNGIGVLVRGGG